jgi:hypothetical protein
MATLGVTVQTRTAPPARGAPTDTDTLFIASKVGTGSTTAATKVRSLADFVAAYSDRAGTTAAVTYDYLDTFFREGGKQAYVGRYTSTVANALALFGTGLGPGQVVAPEETPGAATFGALLDHAAQNNRFAVMDVANGDTVAAMTTLGGAIPATNTDYGMLVGPWVNVPAPAGVIGGGARQVHGSAVAAALMARVDALGNPNRAAAGRDFPLQYATSFVRDVTDAERTTLLAAGVNTYATVFGVLELYGFQTKVAQSPDTPFWQANPARARMWLVAQAKSVGEWYVFRPIDGRGLLAKQLESDLDEILLRLYQANGLYGATPAEAFATTVGAAVNTVGTVAQGELHAVAEARFSLHAKSVVIDLVSVPITGNVSPNA